MLSPSLTAFLIVLITIGGFVFGIIQGIHKTIQKHRRIHQATGARPRFERIEKDEQS